MQHMNRKYLNILKQYRTPRIRIPLLDEKMNIKDDITNKTMNNLQRSRELIHKKDDKTASYNVYSYPRLQH